MMQSKQWLMAGVLAMAGTMVYADDMAAAPAAAPVAVPVAGALSFSGYLDMSYNTIDPEEGQSTDKFGLDRYELRSKYDFMDGLVAEAHVFGTASEDESEDVDLEQANLTYTCPKTGASLIAGKYISRLGYEAYHSPNLDQYSYSETLVYPAAVNGAGLTYGNAMYSIYGAALSGVWDSMDTDADEMGYEAQLKLMPVAGLTLQAGYATENYASMTDEAGTWNDEYDQSLVNLWAEYKIGVLKFAAEWNDVSDWGAADSDGDGYLASIKWSMCSKADLLLRTSALDVEDAGGAKIADSSEFTIAPSVYVTKNWTAVAEYKAVSDDVDGDYDSYALESIVTF